MNQDELVKQILKEFASKIKDTYLSTEDLEQEAHVALVLAQKKQKDNRLIDYVRNHVYCVIRQNKKSGKTLTNKDMDNNEPEDRFLKEEWRQRAALVIETLINRCCPEQRVVIELLYGILDGKCRSYKEVAGLLESSASKIKEIEKKTLETLREVEGLAYVKKKFL